LQSQSTTGFRLSPLQKRLWALQEGGAYRAQCAVLVEGRLRKASLREALGRAVERHEILRTAFHLQAGFAVPFQVVAEECGTGLWREHDLTALDEGLQSAKVEEVFEDDGRPFDLEQESLLRVSLLMLSDSKHLLILSLPALCADSRTFANLFAELRDFYAGGAPDAEEPLQYADFSAWHNELLETGDETAKEAAAFWHAPALLTLDCGALPFEIRRAGPSAFAPELLEVELPAHLWAYVDSLSELYEATASDFLLACWQALLWRHSGRHESVVGLGCDGRSFEDLEGALGAYAKFLPLTSRAEADLPFKDFLKHVAASARELLKWQEHFVWGSLGADAHACDAETNFFPACFEFEEHFAALVGGDVSFSVYRQHVCADRFKLKLACLRRTDGSVAAKFHFDSALFSRRAVELLAAQFLALVEDAARNPAAGLGSLKCMGEGERPTLLSELNETAARASATTLCVHQLFAEHAARSPESIAVVFEESRLTYAELNARANQLAHHLRRLGVGPEAKVGLFTERSAEMIVGLLGILKAGGAYVPLDAALPRERLAYMLEDSNAAVVVTERSLADLLPEGGARAVCLDADWPLVSTESESDPDALETTDNLAYVIYTSGSTGRPKGVLVGHAQLTNYVEGVLERLELPAGGSFATLSTIAADLGNTSVFPALSTGRCLHVVSQQRATDPEAFAEYCGENAIDYLKIVPSHLSAMLSSSRPEQVLPRQRLVLGGEALNRALVEKIRTLAPDCRVVNHYGPTETTVGVLTNTLSQDSTDDEAATVPLGRPNANTRAYVLDACMEPAPHGLTGELYIGGAGVTRGYLNRPSLTAEKFVPDTFSTEPGARLYRTGDVVRRLSDGRIEFVGRADNQVKIRGYRIELGEIEAALHVHERVRDCVVVAREGESGEKRLVAYFVAANGQGVSAGELREYLKSRLPEYMVPAAFARLNELPLTANGKVDRKALPEPSSSAEDASGEYVAPRDEVERALCEVWAEVLRVGRVGIRDNFFELGGDSILSIQVIARAARRGVRVTPRQLFEHQTVEALAAAAGAGAAADAEQGVVSGDVPLTPIQRWFFERIHTDVHHWNQAFLFKPQQQLTCETLREALGILVAHHDALRLRFTFGPDGECLQHNSPVEPHDLCQVVDLSAVSDSDLAAAVERECTSVQRTLDLTRGPLLRAALIECGAGRGQRLLLTVHHLAVDGVSWRILLEDFEAAYQQVSVCDSPDLGPKTTSFRQWAERLTAYARTEAVRGQTVYWRRQSERAASQPARLREGVGDTAGSARSVECYLSTEATRSLLTRTAAAWGTQINDVLLTALALSAPSLVGAREGVAVELEGHGREEVVAGVDLSRTVGWFTTRYPVWLEAKGDLLGTLRSVSDALREVPERGIGYGLLRYCDDTFVAPPPHVGEGARPGLSFNYLGQFDQVISGGGDGDEGLLRAARESCGEQVSAASERTQGVGVICAVAGGRLSAEWSYGGGLYGDEEIASAADAFILALEELAALAEVGAKLPEAAPVEVVATHDDFTDVDLSQDDLEEILAQLA
jgi:amino acid adenylation domain-containing protein/non-ribosomal peptide synthase protein (TIGR01720 family)